MNLPNSSGELPTGSAASLARRSLASALCSAFATAAFSFEMTALGVAAGARIPYHCVAS
jgi:hypothetical protein